MLETETADLMTGLYQQLLGRSPSKEEERRWNLALGGSQDVANMLRAMVESPAYIRRNRVKCWWPTGHFYSPVVDPESVKEYLERSRRVDPADIAGIDLSVTEMVRFWSANRAFIAATPFTSEPKDSLRYYWSDSPYPIGDAVTLRAMIGAYRPRRIIEIGCGFSSACILDTADELGLESFLLTCVEPYADALKRKLRPNDHDRVAIIESFVQDVSPDVFSILDRGDILFIDSTHVLKTGSDVHYEFFSILPTLKPGVIVHFHDCRYPFEYPRKFIIDRNYSWNEAYALRAFLMYNSRFKVIFYNSLFAQEQEPLIRETFAPFLINPGSSIWLEVQ